MLKLNFAIAAIAFTLAAPAMAYQVVGGGFRNKGECMVQVKWFDQAERVGTTGNWSRLSEYAHTDMGCEKIGDLWYIVVY